MFANCSASISRPRVLMVYWKSWPLGTGGWPICPAATCKFCSRKTRITSPAVRFRLQLVGVEPHAHAVVLLPEDRHVADALQLGQCVLELDGGVIAHVKLAIIGPAGLRV